VRSKVKREISPLPVERKFIYGVLTSAEVMPFCHLPPNLTVLPIIPVGNKYQVITREAAERLGYSYLAGWLKEAEEKIWNEARGEKRERVSLYEWLDWQRKLSSQNPGARATAFSPRLTG
jgi:hypothetical protein